MKSWFFGLLMLLCGSREAAAQAPIIAALQDVARTDQANQPAVRLLFMRTANGWAPLCKDSASGNASCRFAGAAPAEWHAIFRGRTLATVATKGWFDESILADSGALAVTSASVPHQGGRTDDFAGWLDRPVHRPLVATPLALPPSAPRWQSGAPRAGDARAILPLLAKHIGVLPDCSTGEADASKGRPLREDDLRFVEVWQSASGERLLAAALKPDRVKNCDYTADVLADVWAYDDGHDIRALPALAEDETTHRFVDAGDFAQDGGEEVLFWLSGYDEDGFILYYDHFAKVARFSWSYH